MLVSLFLLTLLLLFFWRAVFLGRKLLPADIAYTDVIYEPYAPAGFTKPHNLLLYDQAYQFYPWRVYAWRTIRQGSIPFWNPYIYCGAPFLAVDQPGVFYPLNILSYAFHPSDAVLFTALARLFIAAIATYWFVRHLGGGLFGSLVSAITFAFCGFMIAWLGHRHTNVAAWLPVWFLTLEWLQKKPNARNAAWAALAMVPQLTGGHTETALYTLSAGGVYYLFRVASRWWDERRIRPVATRLFLFAVACVLGFVLSSIHLLPLWQWLQQSDELRQRAGADNLRFYGHGPRYWLAGMVAAVLPNIFNNPTWPGEYFSFLPGWNYVEQAAYVGTIGLVLAAVAVIARRRDRVVWFLAALAVVAFGAALRMPVLDWINHLPFFSIASYGRFRVIYCFCLAVLAGLGAQAVLDREGKDHLLRLVGWLLVGFWVIGLLVMLLAPSYLLQLLSQSAAASTHAAPWHTVYAEQVAHAFRFANWRMYFPLCFALLGAVLFLLYRRRALGRRTFQVVLLVLLIADLFAMGMDYHGTVPADSIFPETPALHLVKSDPELFRIVATNIDLMPNTCMVHSLQDVRGLDFPSQRYLELCLAMGGQDWLGYGIVFNEALQPKFLGLLNVKYILTSSQLGPKSLQYLELLAVDRDVKVYRNLACLPRAFIVHQVRVGESSADALQILQEADFEPLDEIVLEKAPPPDLIAAERPRSAAEGAAEQPCSASTRITRYEANHVTILAETSARGFLFLSDSYDPNWKAYVDGAKVEIYQANYNFRAVYLTPGQHTVEFIYESQPFQLAVVGSMVALLLVTILLADPRSRSPLRCATGTLRRASETVRGQGALTHQRGQASER
ncbi:MAG: YfhO family protein [Chloroflexi bacterium]|nr:YfhO family protein [Chloroflexota bacterium]